MGLVRLQLTRRGPGAVTPARPRGASEPRPEVEVSEIEGDGARRRRSTSRLEAVPAAIGRRRRSPRARRRVRRRRAELMATRVIALANQKGGVAKTTTTLNLGVALREQGIRVLLIDLDPQGNLTMSQGMNPDAIERSMFDVLVHRIPISDVIEQREVDIAVASIDLAGAELALSSMIGRERALEKALVEVRDRYDYILIDTPPSLGLLTINAFVAADRRDRAGAVRVPLAARARPAREHARDGAREPQPARRRRGDRPDDVRRPHAALARGDRDPRGELRRPRLPTPGSARPSATRRRP